MYIINNLTNFKNKFTKVAVALGTFDGVHAGHQQVIKKAVELAKQINGTSLVLTFSNHPLSIINQAKCPLQIMLPEYKEQIIAGLGVDGMLHIPFTPELLKLTPEQFIELLINNLDLSYVVVGVNHSFGYKSAGKPEMLINAGKSHGFKVKVQEAVAINNVIVSSTLIRKLILEGKVHTAAAYLDRAFAVQGKVMQGDSRGKELGFPTANISIPAGRIVPADGVYAIYVEVDNKLYQGVANIGNNPTFEGKERRIEAFLFNFNGDIYHKLISIRFIERIRGEVKFENAAQLKKQIAADIKYAQNALQYYVK